MVQHHVGFVHAPFPQCLATQRSLPTGGSVKGRALSTGKRRASHIRSKRRVPRGAQRTFRHRSGRHANTPTS